MVPFTMAALAWASISARARDSVTPNKLTFTLELLPLPTVAVAPSPDSLNLEITLMLPLEDTSGAVLSEPIWAVCCAVT